MLKCPEETMRQKGIYILIQQYTAVEKRENAVTTECFTLAHGEGIILGE
jgi:hypothetical protein